MKPTALASGLVAASLLAACSGPGRARHAEPAGSTHRAGESRRTSQPEPATDAFDRFRGQRVAAGEAFRLATDPIGVDGARIIVHLVKLDWTSMDLPSGGVSRDATAQLSVQRGEQTHRLLLDAGDTRPVAGCEIALLDSGEDYDEATARWQPWVKLRVTPGP